jgi:PAS domain S-box-containing protein
MAGSKNQTFIETPPSEKLTDKKWLQLTADLTKMAIFDWDLEHDRVFANKHFRSLFGYSKEDTIVGSELLDKRIHPKDLPLLEQRLAEAQNPDQKNRYEFEFRALLPDGTQKWVLTHGEVFFADKEENHHPVRVFGTGIDITERREAERELNESKDRLSTFVEASPDTVYRMSPDWDEMYQLQGKGFLTDTHEHDAAWIDKYIPEGDRQQVGETIDEAIQTKSTFELEHRVVMKDGAIGWARSRAVPVMDDEGDILEWFGIATDITERVHAHETIEEQNSRLRAMLNSINDAVYIGNREGIFMVNQPALEQLGYNNEEELARGVGILSEEIANRDIDTGERIPDEDLPFLRALNGEKVVRELRVRNIKTGEDLILRCSSAPVKLDGEIVAAVEVNTDITESKRREERDQFLIKLNDILQPLSDPVEIQHRVSRLLANHFEADRAFYAEITEDDTIIIARDYCQDNMPSIVGEYQLEDFGELSAQTLRAGEILTFTDIKTSADMTPEGEKAHGSLQVDAMVKVPLVKDGSLKAFLALHQSTPRVWTSNEVKLVEEVAERTWAAVERARAEEALSESEEKYRTLFDTINQGFYIAEVIEDAAGKPVDIRYLEVNQILEKVTGLTNVAGKLVSNIAPQVESQWLEAHGRAAQTGEPEQIENYNQDTGRWYQASITRFGGGNSRQVAVVFDDITERKHREERQKFMLKLSDALRPLEDTGEIKATAMRTIGQHMHANRAYYCDIDDEQQQLIVEHDYVLGDTPSLVGTYPIAAFASVIDKVREGVPVVVENVESDPLISREDSESYLSLSITSFLCVPVIKQDTLKVVISLCDDKPRKWTQGEVALLLKIAERTWSTVERVKAEEALRESEAGLKKMNETLEERVEKRTSTLLSYQKQLRSLADKLSKAEENERQHLAGELHDNLGQLLALCKMKIDLLPKSNGEVEEATKLMNDAIRYTRKLMSDLKPPPSLEEEGLKAAMEWAARNIEKHDLKVSIHDDERPKKLDEESRSTVLKAVRELLLNVVKHADTDEAQINLSRKGNEICIAVEDEGIGFNPEKQEAEESLEGGFGLFNIYERIDLLGGNLDIESVPGEGTRAVITVPA